ncbi:MurR/RpiR family transcriptional regulator [Clostridium sp. NSJ-6]|uniref:MurR/RpiR family transcriptional regulator n=1 Tax=Clostridium hominis TaxID=2763036 RepID=A0ABR7D8U1_9CLOT|nr:MurR/RpiR family transcriptional regulator [Clostridium hominis]MBC5627810.1 MurR/RpiR family transcriptional regulator [Clostridium hominis]
MDNRTIRDIIFAEYDNFFDAEKKIANYILNNSAKVVELTIAELAEAAGTSEATVSRFCKRCNVKGFHHLKITLAKELVEANESEVTASGDVNENNIKQSLQNILANKVEELNQTVSMIDEENLREIISLLNNARSIQFAAVGNTIPVAMDGAYKFNQIGIPSVANTIWETQIAYTYNLTKEDVVIVISNSGASKRLVDVVEAANKCGAKVISITNSANSPLSKISDYHITTATREKLFLDEYYFSRISAMTVIEILYLFLTVGKKDVYDNLSRHEQSIADDKL